MPRVASLLVPLLLLFSFTVRTATLTSGFVLPRHSNARALLAQRNNQQYRQMDVADVVAAQNFADCETDVRDDMVSSQDRLTMTGTGSSDYAFVSSVMTSFSRPGYPCQGSARSSRCPPSRAGIPAFAPWAAPCDGSLLGMASQTACVDRPQMVGQNNNNSSLRVSFWHQASITTGALEQGAEQMMELTRRMIALEAKLGINVPRHLRVSDECFDRDEFNGHAVDAEKLSRFEAKRSPITLGDIPSPHQMRSSSLTAGAGFEKIDMPMPHVQTQTCVSRLQGLTGRFEMAHSSLSNRDLDEDSAMAYAMEPTRADFARTAVVEQEEVGLVSSFMGIRKKSFWTRRRTRSQSPHSLSRSSSPASFNRLIDEARHSFKKSSYMSSPEQEKVNVDTQAWHASPLEDRVIVPPPTNSWLQEGDHEHKRIIPSVAAALQAIVAQSDGQLNGKGKMKQSSPYEAQRKPKVSLADYCDRIAKYSGCSSGCFIIAFIYIDRLLARSEHRLTGLNVHRHLLSCMLLAAKSWDDHHYNNAFWAKIGGVPADELNSLEASLLNGLGWTINVDQPEFDAYKHALARFAGLETPSADAAVKPARYRPWVHRHLFLQLVDLDLPELREVVQARIAEQAQAKVETKEVGNGVKILDEKLVVTKAENSAEHCCLVSAQAA